MRHSARCWAKWLLKTDARRRVGRRLLALSLSDNHDLKLSEESRTSRAVEPRAEQVAHVPAPTDRCGGTGACCSAGVLTQLERGRGLRLVNDDLDAACETPRFAESLYKSRLNVWSFGNLFGHRTKPLVITMKGYSGQPPYAGWFLKPPARSHPKGQQDLARVRAPFSTPVHGHGARVLPSNGTLPGGAPTGWAVRGAHRAWPGAGGQRRPLSQLPQRSDRQRRIYSADLPFKSCIESNSRQAYSLELH